MSVEYLGGVLKKGVIWFALGLGLGSCAGPSFELINRPVLQSTVEENVWDSSKLSGDSIQSLEVDRLLSLYQSDPRSAIGRAWGLQRKNPSELRRFALVEMSADQGDALVDEQPLVALGHYLDAAKLCRLDAGRNTKTRPLHRRAISGIVGVANLNPVSPDKGALIPGVIGDHHLEIAEGPNYTRPEKFDLLVPAERIVVKGLDLRDISQEGVGVAMVGKVLLSHRQILTNPFVPKTGFGYALNVRIEFSGKSAKLVLQDVMREAQASINGKTVPLEADFTVAIASYFDERKTSYSAFRAMIRPGDYAAQEGLYMIEPFSEDKIPLFLIHGLQSKALTWVHLANRLRADPLIRKRYQIVLFNYPTGKTVANNAADLREALSDFQKIFDPKRRNPYLKSAVIVGHSMGGVISNMQIRDSGSLLYDSFFQKPLQDLTLKDKDKEEIQRRLFFEANPDLDRVVLIAAPLRGSSLASGFIGRFGSWLIKLPFDIAESALNQVQSLNVLKGSTVEAFTRPRNSITSLRADDPVLPAVLTTPVRKGVKIHSIIAQANEDDPVTEGTDRIVEYSSAHLEGVESEKIVRNANHVSILKNDECLVELWRILHLHLKEFRN